MSFIGINLYTDVELKDGVIVELELEIPENEKSIDIEGEIIWQLPGRNNRFATGVRFIHNNEADKKCLSKFIYDCASRVDETREFIRCEVDADIACSYLDNSKEKLKAKSVDLSRGGMKLVFEKQLKSGDRLHMNFKLPNIRDAIDLEVKVVWVKPCEESSQFEAGIIFTKLSDKVKANIWIFIERSCKLKEQD